MLPRAQWQKTPAARFRGACLKAGSAPILVVAALPEEVQGALRRLAAPHPIRAMQSEAPQLRCWAGRVGAQAVLLAATGDGEENARRGIGALLARTSLKRVVIIGVSGGLDASLPPLELVLGTTVHLEGGFSYEVEAAERARLAKATGARVGSVATRRRLVCSSAEKSELWGELWARDGRGEAAVVDLETGWYVERVHAQGIPWTVLQTVSDAAAESLPEFLEACRAPGGGVARLRVAREVLRHPQSLAALVWLTRRVKRGSEILAGALHRLILQASVLEAEHISRAGMGEPLMAGEVKGHE